MRLPSLLAVLTIGFTLVAEAAERSWFGGTAEWNSLYTWLPGPISSSDIGSVYSGTITVSSGNVGSYRELNVGAISDASGHIVLNGGALMGEVTSFGYYVQSQYTVTMTSGTLYSSSRMEVGNGGTGTMTVTAGYVEAPSITMGNLPTGNGNLLMVSGSSTTFNGGALTIGLTASSNAMIAQNGATVQTSSVVLGYQYSDYDSRENTLEVLGAGTTLTNTGETVVGWSGSRNGLIISDGATMTSDSVTIGKEGSIYAPKYGVENTATVTGSASNWTTGNIQVGVTGKDNTLRIDDGGSVISQNAIIGTGTANAAVLGSGNTVEVAGRGATWTISGSLTVGSYGSDNTLEITDGALVKVGDTLGETVVISALGSSEDNYVRLYGGYLALFGDQTAYVASLVGENAIQVWDGSGWISAGQGWGFTYAYFSSNAAAQSFSGYNGLGGYTILSSPTVVPEPSTYALLALGAGAIAWLRRRKA